MTEAKPESVETRVSYNVLRADGRVEWGVTGGLDDALRQVACSAREWPKHGPYSVREVTTITRTFTPAQ